MMEAPLLNELIDRVARWRGYKSPEEVGKAIEEAKAAVAVPDSLISAVMTSMSTGVAPEKSWAQLSGSYKSWVYSSIDKIGKTVAMQPLRLFILRGKDGKKILDPSGLVSQTKQIGTAGERTYALKQLGAEKHEISSHPFLDCLRHPNSIMSRMSLWYETIMRMELGGLCGWYLPKNGLGLPGEIWPLPLTKTAELTAVPLPTMGIKEWSYRDGPVVKTFQPDEILAIKYPNPSSPYLGFSPLMAQTYPYDIEQYLMQQQRALFQNKGIPGIHFHTEQNLGPEQAKDIRDQIREQFGQAVQSGRPLVTHSGLAAEKTGWSNRDSLMTDVAKWAREKMITSYDLSEAKLGLEVPSNRANMEVLDETFVKECIAPKCALIEEQINTFLLPRYDSGLFVEFDLPDAGDHALELTERELNLRNFVTTINEERARKAKDPVPWGDRPWFSFGNTQDPDAVPAEPAPPAKEEAGEAEEKAAPVVARARRWRRFIARQTPWEKMVTSQMKGYFRNLGSEVVARLHKLGPRVEAQYAGWSRKTVQEHIAKKGVGDDINIDKKSEAARLKLLVKPPVTALVEEGGKRILRELGVEMAFNVNDPKVAKWLGSRMDMFSTEVAGTTFDDIRAVLRQGFSDGKPLSSIADTLREKFDSYDKYRAPLIARTETIAASNKADLLAIRQAGIEEKVVKTWLTAGDENVRPTHQAAGEEYADGIPIDELFQVGDDEMDAPGNGSDPAEVINCRCTEGFEKA
jgi:phage portal protein BeeE